MGRVHVGTSGFAYDHWKDLLYPGVPKARWLPRFAQEFGTVEMNATFYRLPTAAAVRRWYEMTPPGFVFACKGSRFLTHNKKLLDTGLGLDRYFAPVRELREKLQVVLWQLPPQLKHADAARLDNFLRGLPGDARHAVEFRSAAWYTDEICDVLDRHGAAFCEHDIIPQRPPRLTGGFRYLRFHGAGARYAGRYGRAALDAVAEELGRGRHEAYVYFNNDLQGHAVLDARDLIAALAARSARPRSRGTARPRPGAMP